MAKSFIANRITVGDVHDTSIEHVLKTTTDREYHIYRRPGDKFKIVLGPVERPAPAPKTKPPIVKRDKKKKK